MNTLQTYLCVGICITDPDSGYCLGCGRPPLDSEADRPVAEKPVFVLPADAAGQNGDPDTPDDVNQ